MEPKPSKNYLLKGFLYGCIGHILFWLLFLLIFSFLTDFTFIPSLFEKLLQKFTYFQLIISFLSLTLFFGVMGALIIQTYRAVTSRFKRPPYTSLGGSIMLIVALLFLIFNQLFMRIIIGRKLEFFPIENRILREGIFILIAYGLGALLGLIYKKIK